MEDEWREPSLATTLGNNDDKSCQQERRGGVYISSEEVIDSMRGTCLVQIVKAVVNLARSLLLMLMQRCRRHDWLLTASHHVLLLAESELILYVHLYVGGNFMCVLRKYWHF